MAIPVTDKLRLLGGRVVIRQEDPQLVSAGHAYRVFRRLRDTERDRLARYRRRADACTVEAAREMHRPTIAYIETFLALRWGDARPVDPDLWVNRRSPDPVDPRPRPGPEAP